MGAGPHRLGDLAVLELSIRLEGGDDVKDRAADARGGAGADGATVDHEGRAVEAGHGHDGAGHVFVAAGEGNVAIVPLRAHDRLDGIGDDVTGLEGEGHAVRAHGDAIGHTDCVESVANKASILKSRVCVVNSLRSLYIHEMNRREIDLQETTSTPFLTSPARSRRCILQGFPSYHTLEIPIWKVKKINEQNYK
jgi:hypothetical protein